APGAGRGPARLGLVPPQSRWSRRVPTPEVGSAGAARRRRGAPPRPWCRRNAADDAIVRPVVRGSAGRTAGREGGRSDVRYLGITENRWLMRAIRLGTANTAPLLSLAGLQRTGEELEQIGAF